MTDSPAATWRPRLVHDLMFRLNGFGWYAPEFADGVGFRWSGPGRLSGIRMPMPPASPGRGEIHVLRTAGTDGVAGIEAYLNGHPLTLGHRAEGAMSVLTFRYPAAAVVGRSVAELWIAVPETVSEARAATGAPEGRHLGVAVSCIVLEPDDGHAAVAEACTDAQDALPLLLGRRWLARYLAARVERATFAMADEWRALTTRLSGLRLGAVTVPHLSCQLRLDGDGGMRLSLNPADNRDLALGGKVTIAAPAGEPLDAPAGLAAFDRVVLVALLRDLHGHFARCVAQGAAGLGTAPAAALAHWHAALGEAQAGATRSLAMLAASEPEFFDLLARVPVGSIFSGAGRARAVA